MSSASGILLDRASNVKIFEKLASAHLIDTRRLEEVKQMNHMSDLPIGRNANIVVEPDTQSQRDDDSIDEIIADALNIPSEDEERPPHDDYHHRGGYSPATSPSPTAARFGALPLDRASPSPPSSVRSSPRHSPRESPRASPRESPRTPVLSFRRLSPQEAEPPRSPLRMVETPRRTGPPPLPTNEDPNGEAYYAAREYERIRQSAAAPDPVLGGRASSQSFAMTKASSVKEAGYTTMFRDLCKRRHQYMTDRGVVGDGDYRAGVDPDYAEKRELLIKLDEMRSLGFSIPKLDPSMPIEDLQTEMARRTVSMGTVDTVDTVIKWICAGANILEVVNNMTGPFIPMENYAQSVREGTQTPRFKYALYQLTLRFQGRSGGSPVRVVVMVLLMPLIQGLLIKIIQWLAKGRLNNNVIGAGVRTLFNQFTGNKDPNAGVPNGIPGISPDMPVASKKEPDLPHVPSMGNFRPNPEFANVNNAAPAAPASVFPPTFNVNPFSRMQAKEPAQPAPAANVTVAAPSTVSAAAATKPPGKRPRLQKPNELLSEVSSVAGDIPSGVVTAAQRADGKLRF